MKFYAVKKGNKTGVFDNWAECQEATKGFSGPIFKSFITKEEAEAFLNDVDIYFEKVKKDIEEGFVVAFCDGSFDKIQTRYSYGVIAIDYNLLEHHICGFSSNKKYAPTQNIAGEVLGVLKAMDWAVSNGYEKIRIYHDYEGLNKWATREWKANSEIAQAFVAIYEKQYADLLEVDFKKVKGHSNNKYNEKADELAKSAIEDRKTLAVNGSNWFTVPHFEIDELRTILELVKEDYPDVEIDENETSLKLLIKLNFQSSKLTISCFKTKDKKLLVQGKETVLFQILISYIFELLGIEKVVPILRSVYRKSISQENINKTFDDLFPSLPTDYPENIKVLINASIINLQYYVQNVDYSQYAFPAFRALEGHLKYMLNKEGYVITSKTGFYIFDKNQTTNLYFLPPSVNILSQNIKNKIEKCYNYYNKTRHTVLHFGDIVGPTDNTRIISTKEEADEIIKECLSLINE